MNISEFAYRKVLDTLSLLKISYGLFFITVGVDKFFNLIVEWQKYVSPYLLHYIPYTTLIAVVAGIEVLLGILVLYRWTREGGYLMVVWFLIVIVNLLTFKGLYLDIAARDALLAIGALALAWLDEVRYDVTYNR